VLDNLIGKTFGYLTVIKPLPKDASNKKKWLCKCICGREIPVIEGNLKSGNSIRCGHGDCPSKRKDITGKRFGNLVVKNFVESKPAYVGGSNQLYWLCKCDCGNEIIVRYSSLSGGHTKSCGCLQKETQAQRLFKHGDSRTRLYRTYQNIKARCYCESATEYEHYGGRGIRVCNAWINDYMQFKNWSLSHGYKPRLTIDRVNVNDDYTPENCRWVSMKEQSENKRTSHIIPLKGKDYTLSQLVSITDIKRGNWYYRLQQGWDAEQIIKYYLGGLDDAGINIQDT